MPEPINQELLAPHLQAIRTELREIRYTAENDGRNIRSQFDNLVATNASQLGDVEARMAARLDLLETLLGDRFAHLDERVGGVEATMAGLKAEVARNTDQTAELIGLLEQLVRRG